MLMEVEIDRDGVLTAWMYPTMVDENGRTSRGAKISLPAPPGELELGRWARVRASYDRARFELSIDGVTVAVFAYTALVELPTGPLVVGDHRRAFPGSVDTLSIAGVVAEDAVELPEGVAFGATSVPLIRFAPGGHLDRSVHSGPVEIELAYADDRTDRIQVGVYGTVE